MPAALPPLLEPVLGLTLTGGLTPLLEPVLESTIAPGLVLLMEVEGVTAAPIEVGGVVPGLPELGAGQARDVPIKIP